MWGKHFIHFCRPVFSYENCGSYNEFSSRYSLILMNVWCVKMPTIRTRHYWRLAVSHIDRIIKRWCARCSICLLFLITYRRKTKPHILTAMVRMNEFSVINFCLNSQISHSLSNSDLFQPLDDPKKSEKVLRQKKTISFIILPILTELVYFGFNFQCEIFAMRRLFHT